MEMNPHYFYALPESIPEDILQVNPKTKIVLVLCEPAARAYSCFVHFNLFRKSTLNDFLGCLAERSWKVSEKFIWNMLGSSDH